MEGAGSYIFGLEVYLKGWSRAHLAGLGGPPLTLEYFFIMYFSLPECIPPRPLGETRVRKQWSALYYFIAYYNTSYVRFKKNIDHVVITLEY
jgi:hypothetical protein